MTNEIENLLRRVTDRIREAAPEAHNVYLEPHSVPTGASGRGRGETTQVAVST